MTADQLEDQIRASLRRRAARVQPAPTQADPVRRATQPTSRARHPALVAAVVVVLAAAVSAGVALRPGPHPATLRTTDNGSAPAAPPGPPPTTPPSDVGQPARIVLDAPGWRLTYFVEIPPTNGGPYTEYQYTGVAGAHLQISFYPVTVNRDQGARPVSIEVRGHTGLLTDEGAPRYRIDWVESDRIWEADGTPFPSAQALAGLLGHVIVEDTAGWARSLPPGLADAIDANPDRAVSWTVGQPVECFEGTAAGPSSGAATTSTMAASPASCLP